MKPGELVGVVEVTPLTLADRRIHNLLLENAWDAIDKPVTHVIAKTLLRGSHDSNDRIGASLERLMSAIVEVRVVWDGEPAIERVQLLGGNVETLRSDGLLKYEIPSRLRRIIGNSTVFARLRREVMFALTSKYALTLYEMVQKRGNLRWRSAEKFTLAELRGILGVPRGKLTSWSNLKLRAIVPAVAEVNQLSDYVVEVAPIKTGRSVTHVELRWRKKDGRGPRNGSCRSPGSVASSAGCRRAGRRRAADAARLCPMPAIRLPPGPIRSPARRGSTGAARRCRPAPTRRHGCAIRATTSTTSRGSGGHGRPPAMRRETRTPRFSPSSEPSPTATPSERLPIGNRVSHRGDRAV